MTCPKSTAGKTIPIEPLAVLYMDGSASFLSYSLTGKVILYQKCIHWQNFRFSVLLLPVARVKSPCFLHKIGRP